jgi:hypothetical protein
MTVLTVNYKVDKVKAAPTIPNSSITFSKLGDESIDDVTVYKDYTIAQGDKGFYLIRKGQEPLFRAKPYVSNEDYLYYCLDLGRYGSDLYFLNTQNGEISAVNIETGKISSTINSIKPYVSGNCYINGKIDNNGDIWISIHDTDSERDCILKLSANGHIDYEYLEFDDSHLYLYDLEIYNDSAYMILVATYTEEKDGWGGDVWYSKIYSARFTNNTLELKNYDLSNYVDNILDISLDG